MWHLTCGPFIKPIAHFSVIWLCFDISQTCTFLNDPCPSVTPRLLFLEFMDLGAGNLWQFRSWSTFKNKPWFPRTRQTSIPWHYSAIKEKIPQHCHNFQKDKLHTHKLRPSLQTISYLLPALLVTYSYHAHITGSRDRFRPLSDVTQNCTT